MIPFKPSAGLMMLELEIYDLIVEACQQSDIVTAEKLYKIWIKLPSDKPSPLQAILN